MFSTIALIAAAAIAPVAADTGTGPFDPLTANYRVKTGDYCVRSGWRSATLQTGRVVRAGDCRSGAAWQNRGLVFDRVDTARAASASRVTVAAR